MKWLRRWSRILHRDIGYFFIGTSIIYGLSGIALNHLHDWNPSYNVVQKRFTTELDLNKGASKETVKQLVADEGKRFSYKSHYYPEGNIIKVFLRGGSTLLVNTETGQGMAEFLRKRAVFYEVNYLHYNPNAWWMWFSDIFAGALIFLSITSFFMIKGKKGAWGRGGVYIAIGFIIPIVFLLIFS
ncbi:MAG: PepSY-associated TM helix domain-containing protein [Bacteroidota bacterium]